MSTDIPTIQELTALLDEYFIGATDKDVQNLHAEVTRVVNDLPTYAGETDAYYSSPRRSHGLWWREELAFEHVHPTPIDLAAWLASTTKGFPKPKPYCPGPFVGRWTQTAPTPAVWEFLADGRFHTNEPSQHRREAWRIHRSEPGIRDSIWLDDDLRIAHEILAVRLVSPTQLELESIAVGAHYTLVRA